MPQKTPEQIALEKQRELVVEKLHSIKAVKTYLYE